LEREIDLVEEVARVHGYDKIPEDASVPMFPSHRTDEDRVQARCREVLTAAGLDEAMTLSAVEESLSVAYSPWTDAAPLSASMPVLRRADRLRRSLVPSLLAVRRLNESQANPVIELFEIAKVYLPSGKPGELPSEPRLLAITSGGDFRTVKGIIEGLVSNLNRQATITAQSTYHELFGKEPCCMLHCCVSGREPILLGYLGTLSPASLKQFDLRGNTTVAEISLSALQDLADLIPRYVPLPTQPAVSRDLNFVVPEAVLWEDLARTVQAAASPEAEDLQFVDVYRDEKKLGSGMKSLLMNVKLRLPDATLTSEQADAVCGRIVAAVKERHAGILRA
jgi:phenylalanyl-tRNA synthetase beta chain